MDQNLNDYLKDVYYNPSNSASFSSATKLYQKAKQDNKKITLNKIKHWLENQNTYTSHKEVQRKIRTQHVYSPYIGYMYDLDTVNMTRYKKYNKHQYFLVCIDILSRHAYTFPLKTLQGLEMCTALKHVFRQSQPQRIRSDLGSEFCNKNVSQLLKKMGIKHITTTSQYKANYAERLIKSLKTKISKYLYHKQQYKWEDILEDVTNSYNTTYHRSIRTSPEKALQMSSEDLWLINYRKTEGSHSNYVPEKNTYKYKIGDKIKISYLKRSFQRAYDQSFTDEVFIISGRYAKENLPIYILKDWHNSIIQG